jgi:hypothetical protein
LRWYDVHVLVQLEESPEGIPMNALADRILYSKSGFTRVVDRLEEERSSAAFAQSTTGARSWSFSPKTAST